ncbi:glutamate--cysteine ligase [Aurantivibrio plasticivorans]
MKTLNDRLAALQASTAANTLGGILRGIEKESLRVTPEGCLAHTSHNQRLGSALTHPEITTDFSESLLEFITKPHSSVEGALQQLDLIHRYTLSEIGDELLWANSMPCFLRGDDDIPVAQYGSSNVAQMKTIYRLGLGERYGRLMQTIAGVHYNFSFPDSFWQTLQTLEQHTGTLQDFKTQRYFDLIRNFRRYFWLLLYLFGAAPAVCPSFVQGREHNLVRLGGSGSSLHGPFATSLRMGDLGYQSKAQQSLVVNYNNLPDYLKTLCGAITQPHDEYQRIGLKDSNGNYHQLNDGVLQIENEFYSSIRPKRTAKSGETALSALYLRGVEYIEVRCIDLNPFTPLGIEAEQLHFIDTFLLYCLLQPSPPSNTTEAQQLANNQQAVVYNGRDPQLELMDNGKPRSLNEWATSLLTDMQPVAKLLDQSEGSHLHSGVTQKQIAKINDPSLTPSAQILEALKDKQQSFFEFSLEKAASYATYFKRRPLEGETLDHYRRVAEQSIADQAALEVSETEDFDTYRKKFYEQYNYCQEQAKLTHWED